MLSKPWRMIKGAKQPALAKKFLDWASTADMQKLYETNKIFFIPTNPDVKVQDPALDMSKVKLRRSRYPEGRQGSPAARRPLDQRSNQMKRDPALICALATPCGWRLGLFVLYPFARLLQVTFYADGYFSVASLDAHLYQLV
jgi:hypothetical protein